MSQRENSTLMTVEEVAAYLKVPLSWVYNRTRNNSIPVRRIGKYCRLNLSEIEAWVRAGCPSEWNGGEAVSDADTK